MFSFILSIFIWAVLFYAIRCLLHKIKPRKNNERIHTRCRLDEGNFRITGKKDNFSILKDNNFLFEVVNGEIVSIKDISTTG